MPYYEMLRKGNDQTAMRTGNNIRLRKDGRYEARYIKSRDEQDRIVYGYCYGNS